MDSNGALRYISEHHHQDIIEMGGGDPRTEAGQNVYLYDVFDKLNLKWRKPFHEFLGKHIHKWPEKYRARHREHLDRFIARVKSRKNCKFLCSAGKINIFWRAPNATGII